MKARYNHGRPRSPREARSWRPARRAFATLALGALVMSALSCAGKPLVVGFVAPLTGSTANIGVEGLKGARMALAEINQANGIARRQVELQVLDDQADPARTLAAVKELEAAGRQIVILHTTSGAAKEAVAYARERPLLLITRTVSDPAWSGMDDNFLRFISSADDFGRVLASFVKERGETSMAFVLDERNLSYGQAVVGPLLADPGIDRRGSRHSGAQTKAEELASWTVGTGAKALMAVLAGVDAARLAQALERAGFKGSLYLAPWAQDQNLLAYAGAFAGNIFLPSSFNPDDRGPGYLAFKERYRSLYGEDPVMPAVYGYEIISFLAAGAEKARDLSPAALRAAMLAHGKYPGVQYSFALDEFGDMRLPAFILGIERGAYKTVR